jgi:hypothetical protein
MKPDTKLLLTVSLVLSIPVLPFRAATQPRGGKTEGTRVWTNDYLQRLRVKDPVSVVGERAKEAEEAAPNVKTQDLNWYRAQSSSLRTELKRRQADLQRYRRGIEDARALETTPGGINFASDNIGVTPDAAIEILLQRVHDTQSDLDALEDLARRNDIPPGILRGQ